MEEKAEQAHQTVVIEDRKVFRTGGVLGILGFDGTLVMLDSVLGRLCIEGENLKIRSLSKEEGKIELEGKITAVSYQTAKTEGFFNRLFK